MTATEIPLKPFPAGRIAVFDDSAQSPREVLIRARIALSPRGSWAKGSYSRQSHEGYSRCLSQALTDVDGVHVHAAANLLLRAAKEVTGTQYYGVQNFNDAKKTEKYHVIMTLDRAIEMA